MRQHVWHLAAAPAIAMALAQPAAHAQFVKQDYIAIASEDLSPQQFLTGENGKPITLAGVLRLPKLGERLPVVVIMPPAPGVGGPQACNRNLGQGHQRGWYRHIHRRQLHPPRSIHPCRSAKGPSDPEDTRRISRIASHRQASQRRSLADRSHGTVARGQRCDVLQPRALPEAVRNARAAIRRSYLVVWQLHGELSRRRGLRKAASHAPWCSRRLVADRQVPRVRSPARKGRQERAPHRIPRCASRVRRAQHQA